MIFCLFFFFKSGHNKIIKFYWNVFKTSFSWLFLAFFGILRFFEHLPEAWESSKWILLAKNLRFIEKITLFPCLVYLQNKKHLKLEKIWYFACFIKKNLVSIRLWNSIKMCLKQVFFYFFWHFLILWTFTSSMGVFFFTKIGQKKAHPWSPIYS